MKKPQFDKKRPLSWSALSNFDDPDYPEYSDPERWYRQYVLGERGPATPELLFGGKVDKRIQEDPTFLPDLERFKVMQHTMNPVYNKIPLIGYADHYDPGLRLADDKTGRKVWDQARANKTGQLTMYLAMIYLMTGIKPEKIDCYIRWIPTVLKADMTVDFAMPVHFETFKTKRT